MVSFINFKPDTKIQISIKKIAGAAIEKIIKEKCEKNDMPTK